MCKFFNLTSDGKGNIKYMDWAVRKQILAGKLKYNPDSHTSINDYFGYKGAAEDSRNKYEFDPLTGVFTIDQLNGEDDSVMVEEQVRQLDFSQIVPPLIIKSIVDPFKIDNTGLVIDGNHIDFLKKWALVYATVRESVIESVVESVRGSVRDSVIESVVESVGGSVMDSVGDSVWRSVRDSVWESVGKSVKNSVRNSVMDSVMDSVWNSVWASVGGSVQAYKSSFFKIEKWKYIDHSPDVNPFQPAIDLWDIGMVPSFDGKTWRLHTNTGIVYEADETNLNHPEH